MTDGVAGVSGTSNSTRGLHTGGHDGSNAMNTVGFVQYASLGNAADFGDLSVTHSYPNVGPCSQSHGGLRAGEPRGLTLGSGRALFCGGTDASASLQTIDYSNIAVLGNAADFGDLVASENWSAAQGCSSQTRGLIQGGYDDEGAHTDTISSIEMHSLGNASDFGNLSASRRDVAAVSSPTRGVAAGGKGGSNSNVIDYVTITTTGNSTDFGDLQSARFYPQGVCSGAGRGCFGGGYVSGQVDTIGYITISSTGDASDFGNLSAARRSMAGVYSSTRGVWGAGQTPGVVNIIEYITMGSTGNTTDFGDLLAACSKPGGTSSETRGGFGGGATPTQQNVMQYITIASTGDAADFGDLLDERAEGPGSFSDSHGGLQN